MAHYLITAKPRDDRLSELRKQLEQEEFKSLRPFGPTLHHSLLHARRRKDGRAVWEEEDYCSPPLAQEREAALDYYFKDIEMKPVQKGEGWDQIQELRYLFPELLGV